MPRSYSLTILRQVLAIQMYAISLVKKAVFGKQQFLIAEVGNSNPLLSK